MRIFLLILLALALVLIPAGTAASNNKTFKVTVSPNPAPGGSSVPFAFKISNDPTSPNQLGSANVAPPSGFTDISLSGAPAGSSVSGSTVQLRNLALVPGSSITVTITATTPCADPGNLAWATYAKQANDFNGQPGNNFTPYPLSTAQGVTACKLAFANQPADTPVKFFPVKTTKWGAAQTPATGDPIKVKVVSGANDVPSASGTVSIQALGTNCSFATGATTSATFSGGIATFSNLKLNNVATGCQLKAVQSSTGYLDSDPSGYFNVDPVRLFFVTQPKDAVVNTFLSDVKYGGTAIPVAGNPIKVGVRVESQTDSSNLQFAGTGSVSMTISGANCALANSGTTATFDVTGVAAFDSLKPTSVATGSPPPCLLAGSSSVGYGASSPSVSFNVVQYGTYCSNVNNCTITGSDNQQFSNNSTVTASGAQALTLLYSSPNTSDIPDDASCKSEILSVYQDNHGNLPTLGRVFVDPVSPSDPNFAGTYSNTLTLTVNKHWVQLFPNNGNPFIDICFGAQRIDKSTGQPIPCSSAQPPDSTGVGWITKNGTAAGCASDGNYWGLIGSKQNNIPASDPQVVSWTSDAAGNRIFTISLGTVSASQTWFWDYKWSP